MQISILLNFILTEIFPSVQKHDIKKVENKGKLILTEIFPSVQKHDIKKGGK